MTIGHYLKSMNQLTDQFTSSNYRDPKRQRLYLKDIDTPEEWARDLKAFIPEIFYYLNDCIESRTGGDGAILKPNEYGQMRYGKGIAPAGDLMSSLPQPMQALNMMCYIGHEGTYTPAHREMCASLGHNIMVEASVDSATEKAGSSIWFMTETKEREVVSEYFLSMLGHDIEVEKHFAQINAWKKAPFNVWVVEQRVGDLILIPPLAPHQVWNRGTRTMKAAWNRTTVDTLELAINEALPRARMVCREEQYKNKAIIYYTLVKYHNLITRDTVEQKMWKYGRIKQLFEDFKRLFALFTDLIVSEMFSAALPTENDVEFLEYDSNVTCSYCRCNIWNRFLTCKACIETTPDGEEDTYDICMDCYAMGRSCGCISNLTWVEQWDWVTLVQNYELWRNTVIQYDGYFNMQTSPQPLEVAKKRFSKKPVAQICQEQLKIRPWQDIKNPVPRSPTLGMSSDEPEVDDEGRIKKKGGKKSSRGRQAAKKGKTHSCHVCFKHHENWRMAFCTTCHTAYCYGVLWRAFDLMPQKIMEDRDWSCPKCLQICSCGKCRKNPNQNPYSPKGTLLGHDTKKVADSRSVESLVDFSTTNLQWLREENDDVLLESGRMKKLREKAEAEKNREDAIDKNYLIDEGDAHTGYDQGDDQNGSLFPNMDDIDPQLRGLTSPMPESNGNANGQPGDTYAQSGVGVADTNDVDLGQPNGDVVDNFGSLDKHYDLEYVDAFNPGAEYPSTLLAPVALMQAPSPAAAAEPAPQPEPDQAVPEVSHQGQSRMMGIGFYQQGTGADTIAYEPPSLEADDDTVNLAIAANNPNFAFSDLPLSEKEAPAKKRKFGDEGKDEEYFNSKRARKLAEDKRVSFTSEADPKVYNESTHKVAPPRRSVQQPKTYVDLGEESLPFTEDDIVAPRNHSSKKAEREGSDLGLAAQAMSRLSNKAGSEKGSATKRGPGRPSRSTLSATAETLKKKRGRPRGSNARKSISTIDISSDKDMGGDDYDSTVENPKTRGGCPRKIDISLDGSDEEIPAKIPKTRRGRPRGSLNVQETKAANDIPSDEDSAEDGGVIIADDDSLFGDDGAGDKPFDGAASAADSRWRTSDRDPKIQVLGASIDSGDEQQQKAPPKRRGRPPKQSSPHTPAGVTRLLSLKGKLALKGKAFKIVGKKSQISVEAPAVTSPIRTASSTPLIVIPRSVENSVALPSPNGGSPAWGRDGVNLGQTTTRKYTIQVSLDSRAGSSSVGGPTVIRNTSPEGPQSAKLSKEHPSLSSRSVAHPVSKGPTVVRLESPSDYGLDQSFWLDLPLSDDDDDERIPPAPV